MNLSLVDQYKPNRINDILFNQHVIPILKNTLELNNMFILFHGDYGTGKTTMIDILLHEYYHNIPPEQLHNNILTINNLQEQGITYCRNDVKTFCQIQSNIPNKKKTIIIDNIDHINEQSQNVFCNYIDKYNIHVFASCMNSKKVVDSLLTRFTLIQLYIPSYEHMESLFDKITNEQNIVFQNKAKEYVIQISHFNTNKMILFIQKCKYLNTKITLHLIHQLCDTIHFMILQEYLDLCFQQNTKDAILFIHQIYKNGYSLIDIYDSLLSFVKYTNKLSEIQKYKINQLICKYIHIYYHIHEHEFELYFFTNSFIQNLIQT